jgi:hypothetical protein
MFHKPSCPRAIFRNRHFSQLALFATAGGAVPSTGYRIATHWEETLAGG